MGKKCEVCKKKCSGDILKADGDKYFHINCFKCQKCERPLGESGFYTTSDGAYLCPDDYKLVTKTRSSSSGTPKKDVARPSEAPISPVKAIQQHTQSEPLSPSHRPASPLGSPTTCAACEQSLNSGQVLLALGLSWHVFCFKCCECSAVLHGEYMAHEGKPLCIRDYNDKFGVKCYECSKFIAGKVLQAGGYKFHPTCARCSRCGEHFGDGEEMYMQGDEIWHPSCEHSRTTENIAPSKSGTLTTRSNEPKYQSSFGQHLAYMYLLPEVETTYMRHSTQPNQPAPPQFHTPQGPIKIRKSRISMFKTGMQRLAEDLEKHQPRAKSPHMDNEEPIEMAHYPAGQAPDPEKPPAIEREDFPAPPYPYAVEELKRRLSTSSIENDISDDEPSDNEQDEDKLRKTVEQLEKYDDSSLAHIIKQNIEDSRNKQRLPLHWDPRNASRTPSAKKMPHLRFRYDVPINASPSRHLNRPKPWTAWSGPERPSTNTLPNFHMPDSRGGTARAQTLPGGYGAYGHSMENLDTTISSHYSEHNVSGVASTMGGQSRPVGGDMKTSLRSSLPDMSKPARIYPLEQVQTCNKNMPDDVDRQHLERHLAREVFEELFSMSPIEFYKLPEWKRINLKRKVKLF